MATWQHLEGCDLKGNLSEHRLLLAVCFGSLIIYPLGCSHISFTYRCTHSLKHSYATSNVDADKFGLMYKHDSDAKSNKLVGSRGKSVAWGCCAVLACTSHETCLADRTHSGECTKPRVSSNPYIDVSKSGRASKPHPDHLSLDQPRTFTALRRSTLQLQIELECGIWCRARAMAEPPREMEPGWISRKIQLGMKAKMG